MVHFGAKVTNAVRHHWFSGGGSQLKD